MCLVDVRWQHFLENVIHQTDIGLNILSKNYYWLYFHNKTMNLLWEHAIHSTFKRNDLFNVLFSQAISSKIKQRTIGENLNCPFPYTIGKYEIHLESKSFYANLWDLSGIDQKNPGIGPTGHPQHIFGGSWEIH